MTRTWVLVVVLALTGASCTSEETPSTRPTSSATSAGTPSPDNPGAVACPVTLPRPVPLEHDWRTGLFGAEQAHGDGKLWVGGLGKGGVVRIARAHKRLDWKFGWWRAVPGRLRITGQRLDGSAPGLSSHVPTGYGRTGFQSSGVDFPTEGCWEVTGRVGETSLTFVTVVTRR